MRQESTNQPVLADLQLVKWQQLLGNKWSYALAPQMLTQEGYVTAIPARIVGESKRSHGIKLRKVLFTRGFVIAWLAKCFFEKLKLDNYEEAESLLKEAYRHYKVVSFSNTQETNGETTNTSEASMGTS